MSRASLIKNPAALIPKRSEERREKKLDKYLEYAKLLLSWRVVVTTQAIA